MPEKRLLVKGGKALKGTVVPAGAKNAAIKMIAASLLTSEDVFLENVPEIGDVFSSIEIIKSLGAKAEWMGKNRLLINAAGLSGTRVLPELGKNDRTALMVVGPLLARFGEAQIPHPGGCRLGQRPINRHIDVWEALGAKVTAREAAYTIVSSAPSQQNNIISFRKNTCMGTENAIVSSVLVSGETLIHNAAQEPEVDDLIKFLTTMGAKIERSSDRTIKVCGVNHLSGCSYAVMPDRNEVATWAVAAALTRGDITISGIRQQDLVAFLSKLRLMGVTYEVLDSNLRVWVDRKEALIMPEVIQTAPFPGFMTDWQPLIGLLMTQAEGRGLLQETIYTNRFEYTRELNRMGAKIKIISPAEAALPNIVDDDTYDPQKDGELKTVAEITGPTPLAGRRLSIPDLRAGAVLVLAALAAEGKSEIFGVEHIERGYEKFFGKLEELGGEVEVVTQ